MWNTDFNTDSKQLPSSETKKAKTGEETNGKQANFTACIKKILLFVCDLIGVNVNQPSSS